MHCSHVRFHRACRARSFDLLDLVSRQLSSSLLAFKNLALWLVKTWLPRIGRILLNPPQALCQTGPRRSRHSTAALHTAQEYGFQLCSGSMPKV
jgi:hypothetical protein